MKKIRCFFATIALLGTLLSGSILQGTGLASLASTASSRHVSSSFVVGQSTASVATRNGPCPSSGIDC